MPLNSSPVFSRCSTCPSFFLPDGLLSLSQQLLSRPLSACLSPVSSSVQSSGALSQLPSRSSPLPALSALPPHGLSVPRDSFASPRHAGAPATATSSGDSPLRVWAVGGAFESLFAAQRRRDAPLLHSTRRHFSQSQGQGKEEGRTIAPLASASPSGSSTSASSPSAPPSPPSAAVCPSSSSSSSPSSSPAATSQSEPASANAASSSASSARPETRTRPSVSFSRRAGDRTNGGPGFFARWFSAGAILRLLERVARGLGSALLRYTKAVWKYLKLFITNPMIVKKWYKKGKESAIHTWKWTVTGFSLFYANVRVSYQLLKKKILGHPLRYNEHKLLVRTTADALKLIPFSLMIIIPLGELLLPVVLRLFPNMLPSTFFEKQVDNAYLSRKLKAKQELAAFFQELVREHTKNIIEHESNDALKDKAKTLKEFQEKLLQKDQQDVNPFLSVKEILSFARLFKEEFVLEKLDLQTLQVMCQLLGIQPYGLRSHVVLQLRYHLNHIHREDREFMWEGVDTLSHDELVEACKDRAMKFHNISDEDMRQEMRQWLAISSHKDIPPLLLLWCRCISLTHSPIPAPVDLAASARGDAPPAAPEPEPAGKAVATPLDAAKESPTSEEGTEPVTLAASEEKPEKEGRTQDGDGEAVQTPAAAVEESKETKDEEDAEDEQYKRQSATLEAMERQVQLLRAEEESLRQSVQILEEAQRQREAATTEKESTLETAGEELKGASPLASDALLEERPVAEGEAARGLSGNGKKTEKREIDRGAGTGESLLTADSPRASGHTVKEEGGAKGGNEQRDSFLDGVAAEGTDGGDAEGEATMKHEGRALDEAYVDELASVQRGREMLQRRSRRMELELRLLRRLADLQHQHQEEAFGALSRLLELAHAYRLKQEIVARNNSKKVDVSEEGCSVGVSSATVAGESRSSLLSSPESEKLKEHEAAERLHEAQRSNRGSPEAVQIRNDFISAVQAFERQIQEVIESFANGVKEVDDLMRDAKTLQMDEGDPLFYPEDHSDCEDAGDSSAFVSPRLSLPASSLLREHAASSPAADALEKESASRKSQSSGGRDSSPEDAPAAGAIKTKAKNEQK
ncbi:hypothetical protein NCLIV_040900 [Neospora caninum Liverpool]|uniref:LETM1 domain-containing protein LETM2,mitochondrial n=1 Tax=Neospora caninum (strain Liverpool) TaxID=572307 RepID=F0VBN1_NEOCL|nr:hypothetical protein NCLIV_040900 [Neospora caninum Liverpool]CBZ51015.1 hypothetical protein NCLIV_040900 [Neospora caninum Liverpool]CEL68320.1 TPA: LETM1 domain-containing protein LETM2,mitochondrial [Neospora caninum Liverpool]|eukprot:XP_003881048.1 hypothetical protein NCLIV_040900 [Neospora caninum Liverpool]